MTHGRSNPKLRLPLHIGFALWIAAAGLALPPASRSQPSHAPADSASGHGHAGHGHAGHDDATATHRFQDAESWARRFEDPERDAWQLPDSIVARLVHRDDLVIADIGAATGYFPVRFARRVPRGMVIGVDVEPDMVFYLNDRARHEGLSNLVSILAAPDDPHLPRPVDLVFLCDTYHHIDARIDYFRRLQEQLRPGGRVAIVDFRQASTRGPAHKLARDAVQREMEAAGYRLEADHDFLPEQYFLVFVIDE
jgi:SAM-dependent methyltransferase